MSTPIIRASGEGERLSFAGGGLHTWKATVDETDGSFFALEDELTQGKVTPWHCHPEADEIVYVLEGEIVSKIGDLGERTVGRGGMTFAPRGVPHAFHVTSETARVFTIQTPGWGQEFYRGASDPAADNANGSGSFDLDRLKASAAKNGGVEILGPPPFELAG